MSWTLTSDSRSALLPATAGYTIEGGGTVADLEVAAAIAPTPPTQINTSTMILITAMPHTEASSLDDIWPGLRRLDYLVNGTGHRSDLLPLCLWATYQRSLMRRSEGSLMQKTLSPGIGLQHYGLYAGCWLSLRTMKLKPSARRSCASASLAEGWMGTGAYE